MSVIKISKDLYDKLSEIAEKSQRSIKEVVEEAIRIYVLGSLGGSKDIKSMKSGIIVNQYNTKCYRCGRDIAPGELIYWVKYEYTDGSSRSFIYCLDCYYQSSALKEQYLTKKKLEAIIKGLKKEAEELGEKVIKLRSEVKLYDIKHQIYRLYHEVVENLSDQDLKNKMSEFLDKLIDLDNKVNSVLEDLKYFIKKRARKEEIDEVVDE
jgi:hypothetical protein